MCENKKKKKGKESRSEMVFLSYPSLYIIKIGSKLHQYHTVYKVLLLYLKLTLRLYFLAIYGVEHAI